MRAFTWWYRITGVIYLVLGLSWLPTLNGLTLEQKIPDFDGPIGGTAFLGFIDWMLVFSLDLLVIGVFLIVGSWRPLRYVPLFWVVMVLELTRGIADDVYMIVRGYQVGSNLAFIALHAAIIVSGLLCWRAAVRATATTTAPSAGHARTTES